MPKPKKSAHLAIATAGPSEPPVVPSEPVERSYQPASADANARYAEYLRVLDEVPVLLDVVSERPRVVIRDFRLGQRPNVRKGAREDAYAVREQQAHELEQSYCEYALHAGEGATVAQPSLKKKTKRPKGAKRSKRRKG